MSPRSWAERVIAPGEAAEPGVTAKTELSPRSGRQTISQLDLLSHNDQELL
jgi:hypothetical protein